LNGFFVSVFWYFVIQASGFIASSLRRKHFICISLGNSLETDRQYKMTLKLSLVH
jgi:hypothetical protein